MICLSPMQSSAVANIKDWIYQKRQQEFRLGGYAGSGKTSTLKYLLEDLTEKIIVLAPTNKAVQVLRRKGMGGARTIHSYLYRAGMELPCVECEGQKVDFLGNGCGECRGTGKAREMWWEERGRDKEDAELLIVDEASMVGKPEFDRLIRTNTPILWVGDPAQLEPVGSDPRIMHDPDFVLTEVHRTDRPTILDLSMAIREGRPFRGMAHVKRKPIPNSVLERASVIIAGRNATRCQLNHRLRAIHGHEGLIAVGDKVVCSAKNGQAKLVKGDCGVVLEVGGRRPTKSNGEAVQIKIKVDDRLDPITTWAIVAGFGAYTAPTPKDLKKEESVWDYGYCITCHKAQGSEWAKVAVVDESWPGMDQKRWRYTAVTRASEALGFYVGGTEGMRHDPSGN